MSEREASGESLWTPRFSLNVRNAVLFAALDASQQAWERVRIQAHGQLARAYGQTSLTGVRNATDDLTNWASTCDDELFPDVIESFDLALAQPYYDEYGIISLPTDRTYFRTRVRELLREYRVAFDFVDGHVRAFESNELFAGVVTPALTLLAGVREFDAAETAYQNALRELAEGHPADAITDATTALSEALKALGCTDNSLAAQARTAQARGLLTPYDQKLFDWAQADRYNLGDAHQGATSATPADAWLVVHIVGAIIVRLSEGLRG